MSRRDLERWVEAQSRRLAANGIKVVFGFGASSEKDGGSAWLSFVSRYGSGRLIRDPGGSSRVDVYSYVDGSCLRRERSASTTSAQLDGIANLLMSRAAV